MAFSIYYLATSGWRPQGNECASNIREEMMFVISRFLVVLTIFLLAGSGFALGEKKYGPGVTDTEIKIGQTHPYSGPVSALGTMGKTQLAYFEKVNAEGGINGRRIKLISLDDGYNPAKTVEQVRKLVEQEEVLLLFSTNGTPTNTAIHKYVNAKKVPHLFIAAGASKWGDPKNYPWTTAFDLPWLHQARALAKYILKDYPNAKIGILYQNDDAGRDYLNGLKESLGNQTAKMMWDPLESTCRHASLSIL